MPTMREASARSLGKNCRRCFHWQIFYASGAWWAMREGTAKFDGPQALIRRAHNGPDLITLADKLCFQEHLGRSNGLDPEELAEVWRVMALPVPEAAR